MRKWNTIISILILVLFIFHAIVGGFQLMGVMPGGQALMQKSALVMVLLVCVHMVLGLILTAQTLRLQKKSGVRYSKGNQLFWIRRISGMALMLLILWHMAVFMVTGNSVFRLNNFGTPELIGQILLVLALIIHLLTNLRPLFISMGIAGRNFGFKDVLFVLSVILVFCTVAFIIYYFRWNISWKIQ